MKAQVLAILLIGFVTLPALAAKPDFVGQGKSKQHQRIYQEAEKVNKSNKDMHRKQEKRQEAMHNKQKGRSDEIKGHEKQRIKKMEQEQKELGKGSEQGVESREKRRKWWNFFGE
jgi:Ni/Co efflux regulator RcnB